MCIVLSNNNTYIYSQSQAQQVHLLSSSEQCSSEQVESPDDGGDNDTNMSTSDDTIGEGMQAILKDPTDTDIVQLSWNDVSKTCWDCKILLQPSLSDEQRLDIIFNLEKYNPVDTYHFSTKIEYGKNRSFQYSYLKSFLG